MEKKMKKRLFKIMLFALSFAPSVFAVGGDPVVVGKQIKEIMKRNDVPYCPGLVNKGIALSQLGLPSDSWCLEIFDHVLKDATSKIEEFKNSTPTEQLKLIEDNELDDIKELVTEINLRGVFRNKTNKDTKAILCSELGKFPNLISLNMSSNPYGFRNTEIITNLTILALPQLKHLNVQHNNNSSCINILPKNNFAIPLAKGFFNLLNKFGIETFPVDNQHSKAFLNLLNKSNIETITLDRYYLDKKSTESAGFKLDEDGETLRRDPNFSKFKYLVKSLVKPFCLITALSVSGLTVAYIINFAFTT
jgi:hypothetical protein